MKSAVKNYFQKICPTRILKPALYFVRKYRLAKYQTGMFLHSNKMPWFCPCCGMRFRSFASGNYKDQPALYDSARYENTRQDVLCPACKSLPRHRILAVWCERHKEFLRKSEILYFAPEYSMKLWMKRNGVSCLTADLYQDADIKLDIQATELPDESYDVIVCNHVLEHVDDFWAALQEVRRILRRGGLLICSFPVDPNVDLVDEDPHVVEREERVRRFGQYDHLRVFGSHADVLLEEAGFIVERFSGQLCPEEILPVVGPGDYDAAWVYCCVK